MHGGRWFFRPVGNKRTSQVNGTGGEGNYRETAKSATRPQKETDWHKIIWEEYFPVAFSIGISLEEFKHLNPQKLVYCLEGYKIKRKQRDEEMWLWWGNYGLSAVLFAVEHCLAGKKARTKYIDKPIFQAMEEQNKTMTEEELQKQRELFVAKLQIMQTNFEMSHKNKNKEENIDG